MTNFTRRSFLTAAGTAVAVGQTNEQVQPERSAGRQKTERTRQAAAHFRVASSTYQITGNRHSGSGMILTVKGLKGVRYLLVTAAHVIRDCVNPDGSISIRTRLPKQGDPGAWRIEDLAVPTTTERGEMLWAAHPSYDVAVLPLHLDPHEMSLPMSTEDLLSREEISSEFVWGVDVYTMGYPMGAMGMSGFPVMKRGLITWPSRDGKSALGLSFNVRPGDSGSPVYALQEEDGLKWRVSVIGVVTHSLIAVSKKAVPETEPPAAILGEIGVGIVVPSTAIIETIDRLRKLARKRT